MGKRRRPIGNEDVGRLRCKRCNFPCLLTRDKISPGLGLSYTPLTGITQDQAPDDHTVKFGCPQCGKGEYDREW